MLVVSSDRAPAARAAGRDRVVGPAVAVGAPRSRRCDPRRARRRRPVRDASHPTTGARRRSPRCTTRASSSSWSGRGATTRSAIPARTTWCPTCSVDPGLLDGIGPLRDELPVSIELGKWCFETTTPLTEGTYEAARGAVDIALTRDATGPRRCRPRVRPLPPARPSRPDGRCTAATASSTTPRSPRTTSRRRPAVACHGARRRLPPRQRHAADLLRPRRRAVRVAARRPGAGLPVRHRVRRRDGRRARERGATSTCRSPRAPTTTATSPRWRSPAKRSTRSIRPSWSCRSASTRTTPTRSPISA